MIDKCPKCGTELPKEMDYDDVYQHLADCNVHCQTCVDSKIKVVDPPCYYCNGYSQWTARENSMTASEQSFADGVRESVGEV